MCPHTPGVTLCSMEEDGTDISSGILVHLTVPARVADAMSSGLGLWRYLMEALFPEQGARQWLICLEGCLESAEDAVVRDIGCCHDLWGYGGGCSAQGTRHISVHS